MKICRSEGGCIGVLRGEQAFDVTRRATPLLDANVLASTRHRLAASGLGADRRAAALTDGQLRGLVQVEHKLLSPVARPGKIVAAPVNYSKHIAEMQANNVSPGFNIADIGNAGLFMKANRRWSGRRRASRSASSTAAPTTRSNWSS